VVDCITMISVSASLVFILLYEARFNLQLVSVGLLELDVDRYIMHVLFCMLWIHGKRIFQSHMHALVFCSLIWCRIQFSFGLQNYMTVFFSKTM